MQKGHPDRQVLFRPTAPWQIYYVDFISLPRSTSGKFYALTVMDGYQGICLFILRLDAGPWIVRGP